MKFPIIFLLCLIVPSMSIFLRQSDFSLTSSFVLEFERVTLPVTLNFYYDLHGFLTYDYSPSDSDLTLFSRNFKSNDAALIFINRAVKNIATQILQSLIGLTPKDVRDFTELTPIIAAAEVFTKHHTHIAKNYYNSSFVSQIYEIRWNLILGAERRKGSQEIRFKFNINARKIVRVIKRFLTKNLDGKKKAGIKLFLNFFKNFESHIEQRNQIQKLNAVDLCLKNQERNDIANNLNNFASENIKALIKNLLNSKECYYWYDEIKKSSNQYEKYFIDEYFKGLEPDSNLDYSSSHGLYGKGKKRHHRHCKKNHLKK